MRKTLLSVCSWLMVLVLPFQAVAASTVGTLSTIGTVLVDSQPVGATSAVFAGDLIETRAKSKAIVADHGKTLTVAENSAIRLGADALEIRSGAVLVSSTASSLRIDNITVTSNAPSKFLARKVNGSLQLLTLEGSVLVSNGQESTQVPATKGVSIGSPGKRLSWLLNDDIGILIVVVAAVTAGVTLGIVNAQNAKPVTPAAP